MLEALHSSQKHNYCFISIFRKKVLLNLCFAFYLLSDLIHVLVNLVVLPKWQCCYMF